MSIDLLHEKIRKLKNPLIVDLTIANEDLPPVCLEKYPDEISRLKAYYQDLMEALKGVVPGFRLSFLDFAMKGAEGLQLLSAVLSQAKGLGFFTILDVQDISTPLIAQKTADTFFSEDSQYRADAIVISPYIGSEAIKPFLGYCKESQKSLAVTVRSPNKSASELQDLITGSRQVYVAAAELVARYGEGIYGKCSYSQVFAVVSATAPEAIRSLRAKYKFMFLLVDGLDYPAGNAKNCSLAFDRFGHGAAICVGGKITSAWKEFPEEDFAVASRLAAERIAKNLQRYLMIL